MSNTPSHVRKIPDHITDSPDLAVIVTDAPGSGGANHRYEVHGMDLSTNPSAKAGDMSGLILFQNGPVKKVGVNGLTNEVLLSIVADRLRSFQAGPCACPENAVALNHINDALAALRMRTIERMRRGVEGTDLNHVAVDGVRVKYVGTCAYCGAQVTRRDALSTSLPGKPGSYKYRCENPACGWHRQPSDVGYFFPPTWCVPIPQTTGE
jgi:hypothetical protein